MRTNSEGDHSLDVAAGLLRPGPERLCRLPDRARVRRQAVLGNGSGGHERDGPRKEVTEVLVHPRLDVQYAPAVRAPIFKIEGVLVVVPREALDSRAGPRHRVPWLNARVDRDARDARCRLHDSVVDPASPTSRCRAAHALILVFFVPQGSLDTKEVSPPAIGIPSLSGTAAVWQAAK